MSFTIEKDRHIIACCIGFIIMNKSDKERIVYNHIKIN